MQMLISGPDGRNQGVVAISLLQAMFVGTERTRKGSVGGVSQGSGSTLKTIPIGKISCINMVSILQASHCLAHLICGNTKGSGRDFARPARVGELSELQIRAGIGFGIVLRFVIPTYVFERYWDAERRLTLII